MVEGARTINNGFERVIPSSEVRSVLSDTGVEALIRLYYSMEFPQIQAHKLIHKVREIEVSGSQDGDETTLKVIFRVYLMYTALRVVQAIAFETKYEGSSEGIIESTICVDYLEDGSQKQMELTFQREKELETYSLCLQVARVNR